MKKKIIVSGANGQLGTEIQELSVSFPQYDFRFLTRDALTIDDGEAVRKFFSEVTPHYFINCAAYTAVDNAEKDAENAYHVNATATGEIAAACAAYGTRFIHVSTDYVFDGTATVPYKESDQTGPQSQYGSTKLEGEKLAIAKNADSMIIRTAWVYSTFGKNFVKTMLRLMSEREAINVVSDQVGSPTYAADLAAAIMKIVNSGDWHPGVYHYSNTGIISWYDFAIAIRDISGSNCKVSPIPAAQYPTPAKRPAYSVLDTTKIKETYGIQIPEWRRSLEVCLGKMKG